MIHAADGCEINFGKYNIIEEGCRIIAKPAKNREGVPGPGYKLEIGDYNWFEACSDVKAKSIGNVNHF
jgi:hypothetical protein